jgi:hypothetical protein
MIKIKNSKVFELDAVIDNIENVFKGEKIDTILAFNLDRNKFKLEDIIKSCKKVVEPTEDYKKYEQQRMGLVKECAEKDEQGQIAFQDEHKKYVKLKDVEKFKAKMDILTEKFEKDIQIQKDKEEEFNKLMDVEVEIDLIQVSINDFPKKVDDTKSFKLFYPIIKEFNE